MATCLRVRNATDPCTICTEARQSCTNPLMIHEGEGGKKHPPIHRACWRKWAIQQLTPKCPMCQLPINKDSLFSWSEEFWVRAKRASTEGAIIATLAIVSNYLSENQSYGLSSFALSYIIHDQLWMVDNRYKSRAKWTWPIIPAFLFPKHSLSGFIGIVAWGILNDFNTDVLALDSWRRWSRGIAMMIGANLAMVHPSPVPAIATGILAGAASFFKPGLES